MMTGAHVFLFDADADGISSYYGGYFDSAFLLALSAADAMGKTYSRVRRGDAMLHRLTERIEAVSSGPSRSSHTVRHDMPLYKSLIWDLADALGGQWHTLDLDNAPLIIANHRIHCIMLPHFPLDFREAVDSRLVGITGYLGAFEIDHGNPAQRFAFAEWLIYDAAITGGQIVRELGFEGYEDTEFEGAEAFEPNGAIWQPFRWLRTKGPQGLPSTPLSERGKCTNRLLTQKRRETIEDKVIDALARLPRHDASDPEYSFVVVTDEEDVLQAILPEGKFTKYLFELNHPEGGSKAKFFTEELGIAPDDWRFLAAQFYEGLQSADLDELEIKSWGDGYGANFVTYLQITGRNEETRNVKTVWMMKPGLRPTLVTAVPASNAAPKNMPGVPPVVSADLSGDAKWPVLFKLAHSEGMDAATSTIPTPMKLENYPVIEEGECGSALVRVADARTGFARWLLKTDKGSRHYRGGASVYSAHPSQSIDRARAYARAFAAVLKLNGVASTIETYDT